MEEVEDNLGGGETSRREVVAGCSKSSPLPEVSQGEDVIAGSEFLRIFSQFDLVVEKILSYLNFKDMTALSESSKDILDTVRKTAQFSKRAKLNISDEVIQSGFLKECTVPWKHVTFDLDLLAPVGAVDLFGNVLEGAESVCLELLNHHRLDDDGGVTRCLEKVLTETKGLKTLGLDFNIMNYDLFSNVGIQLVMSKVQCLEIRISDPSIRYYIYSDDDNEMLIQRNLLQLSAVPLSLKSLLLGKEYAYFMGSGSKYIPKIVESTKNTLQDLELHYDVWKFEEMKRIRCPNLKRLTLSTIGHRTDGDGQVVEAFLKNQPPLEELVISYIHRFPARIFLTIQGMNMKMKKLHLKAPRFTGRSGPMDWQFLEDMTELKDFELRKSEEVNEDDDYDYGEAVLLKLPATTEKISLQGVPFWRYDREDAEENIGNLLARFENLRELDLLRCTGSVTNDGLQSIISNCRKLVSLTFSDCYELTDYGISGVHPPKKAKKTDSEGDKPKSKKKKTGVSLEELTGLIHLKIRDCPNIHYKTLLRVVKFRFLRSFDYYKDVGPPKDFLSQIVRQNPCLESITLNMDIEDSEHFNELKEQVKQINSRVQLFNSGIPPPPRGSRW